MLLIYFQPILAFLPLLLECYFLIVLTFDDQNYVARIYFICCDPSLIILSNTFPQVDIGDFWVKNEMLDLFQKRFIVGSLIDQPVVAVFFAPRVLNSFKIVNCVLNFGSSCNCSKLSEKL